MAEPFIAQITMFGGNFAPRGWAFCDGQLLDISQHTALFSLLGTTYGGDGRTTFALPDLRGRAPIHEGSGPGLPSYTLGRKGGVEQHVLQPGLNLTAEPHSHPHPAPQDSIATPTPDRSYTSSVEMIQGPANVTLDNMQPFLGIYFIIALQGIFPSRN
jgi:microcystin-dependent protein